MTDKELIKEEIESYKESMKGLEPHSDFRRGQITAYNQIMQFIDSLPEEHNDDLDEEIDRFEDWLNNFNQSDYPTSYTVRDIARHFTEWQKQKDLEDSLKSDMTMPNKFYEKGKADAMNEMKETLQTEYEKGRFDMREEMMKNTVLETKVMMDCDGDGIETPYEEWLTLENTEIPYIPEELGLKEGDRVEIIIIKED